MSLELERVGAEGSRPPAAPLRRRAAARLSPNLVALFGALLGLAVVASIVALAIQLGPTQVAAPAPSGSVEAPSPAAESKSQPKQRRRPRQKIAGPWRIRDAKGQPGMKILSGTVGRLPFLRAVQDAGLPKKQAYRLLIAMKGLRDLDKCNKSDQFVALLDRASRRLKAFEYIVSKEEVYQAREGQNGLLAAKRLDLKVQREQVSGVIAVSSPELGDALHAAGFEAGITSVMQKALDGHLPLEEIQPGDVLRVIAQEVTVLGEFSRYAGIEALEYRPGQQRDKPLRVYYFRGPESRGYYDSRGRAPYEGGWRKPIPGAPVTSPFNLKRMHPVLKKVMPHYGVDFGAPAGTPVGASSYGRVSFIGYAGAAGNLVKIEHPGEIETGYAHLIRFAEGLRVGDRVKRLQVIGYVGSTGRSTGPHLHFSAKKKGKFIDPMSLKLDAMRVLPKAERDEFRKVRKKYDRLLDALPLPKPTALPEPAVASAPSKQDSPAGPEATDLGIGAGMADQSPERAEEREAPTPTVEAAKPASKPASANPVYLTDRELLEMQPLTDDGEVAE